VCLEYWKKEGSGGVTTEGSGHPFYNDLHGFSLFKRKDEKNIFAV